MASFKDRKGNIWDVELLFDNTKKVEVRLGIDLFKIAAGDVEPLGKLVSNQRRMVEMLHVLCEDQIRQRNMSDEDFGRLFDGDTIDAGTQAFEVALVDFSRKSNPLLKKVFDKAKAVTEKSQKLIEAKLESLTADEIIANVQRRKNSADGSDEQSGNVPVS